MTSVIYTRLESYGGRGEGEYLSTNVFLLKLTAIISYSLLMGQPRREVCRDGWLGRTPAGRGGSRGPSWEVVPAWHPLRPRWPGLRAARVPLSGPSCAALGRQERRRLGWRQRQRRVRNRSRGCAGNRRLARCRPALARWVTSPSLRAEVTHIKNSFPPLPDNNRLHFYRVPVKSVGPERKASPGAEMRLNSYHGLLQPFPINPQRWRRPTTALPKSRFLVSTGTEKAPNMRN